MVSESLNRGPIPWMSLGNHFLIASIEWQLQPYWNRGQIGNAAGYFDRFTVHWIVFGVKRYTIYVSDYDATKSDEEFARAPRRAFGSHVTSVARDVMETFEQANNVTIHHFNITFAYLPDRPDEQVFCLYYAIEKATHVGE